MSRQLTLFGVSSPDRPINVASVPQRSPFRYPGGKTWLIPHVRRWLGSLPQQPSHLVEPFAGGGIVSLTVAAESLAAHVTMVEMDPQVAAVWRTILLDEGGAEWLAQQILAFEVSLESVKRLLDREPNDVRELAFQTVVKNRVFHGGILAPGSAPLKHGENRRGIASRWYPGTLARRIREILRYRQRMSFIEGDGLAYMAAHQRPDTAYFIDPPYTGGSKQAGRRLYNHFVLDHALLFDLAAKLQAPFLMTYDDDAIIARMAQGHGFSTATVPMKNTHHAEMRELLIARDVSWLGR